MTATAEAIETATATAAPAAAAAPAVSWVPFAVIGAVLLAAGAAAWIFIRRAPKKSFSLLLEKQVTADVLDGALIHNWARETPDTPDKDKVVAFANRRWITKLGYRFPEGLDETKTVVAFEVDKVRGTASHERLFSFSEMSDHVKGLFGSEDCFFLRN